MAHPAVGGKGLPPVVSAPVYVPSSPAASSSVSGAVYHHHPHHSTAYNATTAGPPPDLTARIKLKARYLRLQSKYNRSIEARKDLEIELEEKEATQQRLQDEVDLIIDQIYDSDYAHLLPKHDSLFSDDEGEGEEDSGEGGVDGGELARVKAEEESTPNGTSAEGEGGATKGRKGKRKMGDRDLDELEAERRAELEARYGIDGTRQNVSKMPTPPPPAAPQPPQQPQSSALSVAAPPPPPSHPSAVPPPQSSIPATLPNASNMPAPPQYPTQPALIASSAGASVSQAGEAGGVATVTTAAPMRLKLKFGGGGGGS
ncbi:hypothetical protein JCM10908_001102 [Rhodotorula pacifica]|uniref:uncharacterized protein n=1 Tax=Rhodotorula pacifica TaxID=1495444 RepID=UPI0031818995